MLVWAGKGGHKETLSRGSAKQKHSGVKNRSQTYTNHKQWNVAELQVGGFREEWRGR